MSMTGALEPAAKAYVEAVVRYTDPGSEGAVLHSQDHDSSTFKLIPQTVRIHDARRAAGSLSFEENGFTLLQHRTDVDLLDKADVDARYYPQAAQIVRELTGAREVLVFLDVIRSEVREEGAEPANNAHVDFDQRSIHAWVRMLRPDDAEDLLKKRILNINLWRGINPVERMPLAVCDARTVSRGDLIRTIIGQREGSPEGPFSGFNLGYSPNHRWHYYPDMQPDEVLAFKLYDSDMDRPHLTAHTAFEDPTSRPDAPRRLSHEIRTIAFLD